MNLRVGGRYKDGLGQTIHIVGYADGSFKGYGFVGTKDDCPYPGYYNAHGVSILSTLDVAAAKHHEFEKANLVEEVE